MALSGVQIALLAAALEEAFTLDGLRQMLRSGLSDGLSLNLDAVVATPGRTLHEICHDLVLWALHDEHIGLQGLLAAAVRCNPGNPQLAALQTEWAGVTFTRPACPYPGMKPFTAEWGYFYGREMESQEAVDCLRRFPFLAIIGPSGSGKSSLLHAGILPALTRCASLCRQALGGVQPAPGRGAARGAGGRVSIAAGIGAGNTPAAGRGPV